MDEAPMSRLSTSEELNAGQMHVLVIHDDDNEHPRAPFMKKPHQSHYGTVGN